MTEISHDLRQQVTQRADDRCEYCRIPTRGQIARFPIDHVVPRSRQGKTELANLALACPRCNAHKWAHEVGTDPESDTERPLFDPRTQIWSEHLRWSPGSCEIEGITPCGRATVATLRMNDPEVIAIRRLLADLGVQVCDQ